MPRGVAVQADLGGVTGGQASLYLRATAAHDQITRMLDSLTAAADRRRPRGLRGLPHVWCGTRVHGRCVDELGHAPAARASDGWSDSAFAGLAGPRRPRRPLAVRPSPRSTRDSVPGQLGALRDRFGLVDDHVNTVDEEKSGRLLDAGRPRHRPAAVVGHRGD